MVTVRPDERVFRGETVTLRCDIKWGGDTVWTYRWEREGTNWYENSAERCTEECSSSETDNQKNRNAVSWCLTQELNISSVDLIHGGKYSCRGQKNTQCSQRSDAVTLTVSGEFVCVLIIISVNSFSLYNCSCFVQLKLRQQWECLHSRG